MLLNLVIASAIVCPALSRAQETAGAANSTAPVPAKTKGMVFHGKVGGIDVSGMTLQVGKRTFRINAETKITKDGQPAALGDGVAGESVGGAYVKGSDGALQATTVHFGKSAGKKKKSTATQ